MNKREIKYYAAVVLIALLASLTFRSFGNRFIEMDSGVFQYVATEIRWGNMPYLDTFDHKGPLLYVINLLGLLISPRFGIWLLELLTVGVSFLFLYRIARLCAEPWMSVFAVGLSAIALIFYVYGGNLTEEYALPLIAVSLYIFLRYFIAGDCRKWDVFWCGVCFGGVLLLRPNMIAVWIAGCFLVLIDCVRKRAYRKLLEFIVAFLLGIGAILMPFVLWLYQGGALKAAYEAYILFNFQYTGYRVTLTSIFNAFSGMVLQYLPILSLLGVLLMASEDRSMKFFMIALSWILSVVLIVMPGKNFSHYAAVLVPNMAYSIAYVLSWFSTHCEMKTKAVALAFAALLLVGVIPKLPSLGQLVATEVSYLRGTSEQWLKTNSVVERIVEKTTPEDKITVYGNANGYYLFSNRMSASRYSFQNPIDRIDPNIPWYYFDELEENNPKVIVWPEYAAEEGEVKERMDSFIQTHGYVQDSVEGCVFYLP